MKSMIFEAKDRLSADELKLAAMAAEAAGLTLDQWLERSIKATIYAPILERANNARLRRESGPVEGTSVRAEH